MTYVRRREREEGAQDVMNRGLSRLKFEGRLSELLCLHAQAQ